MPKGPTGQKRPADTNRLAFDVVAIATGEKDDEKTVDYRQKAGRKGGKSRAKSLTSEQRSEIAQKAAKARWAKKD